MYVLTLRKRGDETRQTYAVAHSDSFENVAAFVQSCVVQAQVKDPLLGTRTVTAFGPDSELAEYELPDPADGEVGIINLGTLDDRVAALIEHLRPQLEEQVRSAWATTINGTIKL